MLGKEHRQTVVGCNNQARNNPKPSTINPKPLIASHRFPRLRESATVNSPCQRSLYGLQAIGGFREHMRGLPENKKALLRDMYIYTYMKVTIQSVRLEIPADSGRFP